MSQHILFVDDEVPIRETLSIYFRRKGITVTTAENGAEAVRLAGERRFDLVILDIGLGAENGLEVLTLLKDSHPKTPVIMFTAQGYDPVLLNEAMAKGASGFMSKTEPLDVLMKQVQRVILPAQA